MTQEREYIPWKYRPRRFLERYGSRGLAKLVRFLPRRAGLRIGDVIACIFWVTLPKFRRQGLRMLATAFGDKYSKNDRTRILSRSYRSICRAMIDFLRFPKYSKEDLLALCAGVEGWEHLEKALEESPGSVIALASHIGSWEFSGAILPALGATVIAVGREQRESAITNLLIECRTAVGIEHIPRSKLGNRKLIESFKRKGTIVGLLSDQNGGKNGIFVPFFGKMASTVRGPAFFALRFNVPIVPIFAVWEGDKYRVLIWEPVEVVHHEDKEEAVRLTSINIQKVYEKLLTEHADQYMWVHDRWKTRPPDELETTQG